MAAKNSYALMMPGDAFMKEYSLHRHRLDKVTSQVDHKTPMRFAHLDNKLKQIQLRERRQDEIDRENKILLNRMTHILLGKNENSYQYHQGSVDMARKSIASEKVRQRDQERVMRENREMAKRIQSVQPIYSREAWEADWKIQQNLLRNLEMRKYKVRCNAGTLSAKTYRKLMPKTMPTNHRDRPKQRSGLRRGQQRPNSCHGEASRSSHTDKPSKPDLWMYYGTRPREPSYENVFFLRGYKNDGGNGKAAKRRTEPKEESTKATTPVKS